MRLPAPLIVLTSVLVLLFAAFTPGAPTATEAAMGRVDRGKQTLSQVGGSAPHSFDCALVSEIPLGECQALVALYTSTDGPNWTNRTGWLQTTTPCSWYGVSCGGGRVVSLTLMGNELSGSLPPELGNLTNLDSLWLEHNQLSGSIPSQLSSLANLRTLSLGYNQLSGSLPPELGSLTNLRLLYLDHNQLSGSIPSQLGSLANLLIFTLNNNQLSGSLPPELGNLANLQTLHLDYNQLSGAIPVQLGNLANLGLLHLNEAWT